MQLLTLTFWKSVWIWCKVNWKFLVGFGIPIVVGILLRKNQQTNILKKGLEFRKEQFEIERKAAGIEKAGSDQAVKEYLKENERLESENLKTQEQIEKDRKERLKELSSADKVTEEINDRLRDS